MRGRHSLGALRVGVFLLQGVQDLPDSIHMLRAHLFHCRLWATPHPLPETGSVLQLGRSTSSRSHFAARPFFRAESPRVPAVR